MAGRRRALLEGDAIRVGVLQEEAEKRNLPGRGRFGASVWNSASVTDTADPLTLVLFPSTGAGDELRTSNIERPTSNFQRGPRCGPYAVGFFSSWALISLTAIVPASSLGVPVTTTFTEALSFFSSICLVR